jgi:hypothetical protein
MSQLDSKMAIINDCFDDFYQLNNAYYLIASIKNVLENREIDDTEWVDHVASLLYRYIDETEDLMPKIGKALNKLSSSEKVIGSKPMLQRVK